MNTISKEQILDYAKYLVSEEHSKATIEKYIYEIEQFRIWLGNRAISKEITATYKEYLHNFGKAAVSVNVALAAIHTFYGFIGLDDCKAKYLKCQRSLFRDESRELMKRDYERLVSTAYELNNPRLALISETICATGIRVSELKYITLEALKRGKAEISLKCKVRTILLPNKLCRKLLKYAHKNKIASREIFLTGSGRSISRGQIWSEMKKLCRRAKVEASKVFPHNLRHLFARVFYTAYKDIVKLADVLGHSNIETTRIYLISTGREYQHMLERLNMIS